MAQSEWTHRRADARQGPAGGLHVRLRAVVYGKHGCPACVQAVQDLRAAGCEVATEDAGRIGDVDAFTDADGTRRDYLSTRMSELTLIGVPLVEIAGPHGPEFYGPTDAASRVEALAATAAGCEADSRGEDAARAVENAPHAAGGDS